MEDTMHTVKSAEPATSCSDSSVDRAEIVVVRHGQTECNVEKIIRGHLDVELNEVGRLQAHAVADRLSKEGEISAIYSSDLKRATETAELIAIACGGVEVTKDPALRDRNAGILQCLKRSDAANVYPQAYEAYRSHRRDQEIPGGGENKYQLYQRCTTCLRNIGLKHKGERVVVVTHGSFLACLYRQAHPNEGRPGAKIQNASVSVFHLFGEDDWVIKSWVDISHLNHTEEKLY
ncbi:phosphoglycerate mutase-like protein 4 isoform X2 [Syzygium oleosum]|uniref:phosphoglycerate mutase-like protein 4 isoform X2 n=1 Tax=Syzygium oleosum TaxID=219896 RepID=UPI0024B964CF|nr:phosphoglycerate mutase-like protein 4 isoform X2 [Syzygium oleosum]